MNAMTTRTIVLAGRTLTYTLARKAVKNINLRIRPDGTLYVSAPPSVPLYHIEGFLKKQESSIMQALRSLSRRQQALLRLGDGDTLCLAGKPYTLDVRLGLHNTIRRSGQTVFMEVSGQDPVLRQRLYHSLLRQAGERLFPASLSRMFPQMQDYAIPLPALRQRVMRSRWGSCMPFKEIITMNTYLAIMPESLIDQVMLHELCHLVHPDHSRHFYNVMTCIMPDWKERRAAMEQYLPYCV